MSTVILANGRFPTHATPLALLKNAHQIVCCDGSVEHLQALNLEPTAIVGDLDSVSEELKIKYSDRLYLDTNQDTNDLTKAVNWCKKRGYSRLSILAGTGKRDDHTLGNIGLLPSFCKLGVSIEMITDFGTLVPLVESSTLESFEGQQVSIFSFNNNTRVTTHNLKYQIENQQLPEPWMGTLNVSLGSWFKLEFDIGSLVVFMSHKE